MPITPIQPKDLIISLSERPGGNTLKLSAGEIIKGLVLDNIDSSTVLLRVKGQDIVSHVTPNTSASLPKGAEVFLKVTSLSPTVILNLVNDIQGKPNPITEKISTSLMQRMPNKEDLNLLLTDIFHALNSDEKGIEGMAGKELICRMKEGIDSAIYKGSKDGTALKEIIKNSGLMFESKLKEVLDGDIPQNMIKAALHKDLKAIVIDILSKIKDTAVIKNEITLEGSSAEPNIFTKGGGVLSGMTETGKAAEKGSFQKAVEIFLDNIEIDQISNYISKDSNSVSLNIPFLDNSKLGNAKIYIKTEGYQKGKGSGKEKENYMVVFFLSMTNLGDMRIDLYSNNNILNCAFKVSDQDRLDFIKRCSEELLNNLKDKNVSLSFEVNRDINKEKEGFERDSSVKGTGILDILI